ncbi:MAG: hypothetical protein PVF58_14225 [Candidatus Methanofastidiosia archaeon]|jgi:hypothetical protein
MTDEIPKDFCKARVVFTSGEWIEAEEISINFDTREVTLYEIGEFSISSNSDKEALEENNGISFLPEIEPVKEIVCDAGSFTLPFKKIENETDRIDVTYNSDKIEVVG